MDPSGSKRKGDLIPLTSLKRQKGQGVKSKQCLFRGGKDDIRCSSEEGKNRIIDAARERQRLNDTASSSIIEKILSENEQDIATFKYHHKCYSNFTDKGKIARIRKKHESTTESNEGETSKGKTKSSRCSSREHSIDWNLCMFCQDKSVTTMHNVSTMELSEKIIGLAQSDLIMRVRMANVSDLVASEGKYHLKCWVLFQRKISRLAKQGHKIKDPCLDKICSDIVNGLTDRHVYDMGCVWSQYVKSCSVENVDIPQRYQSRKSSFYDDVNEILGDLASFARPINTQSHLLIYPSKKSQLALAQQLTLTSDNEESDMILPVQDNSLQQLVHSALHIRNELQNTDGHTSGWGWNR